jgi:phosphoglycolate phosphatase-like HAD superfamily hydrolase
MPELHLTLATWALVAVTVASVITSIIISVFERRKSKLLREEVGTSKKHAESWEQRVLYTQQQIGYSRTPTERAFLDTVNLREAVQIKVLAHTGKILVESLKLNLESLLLNRWRPLDIRILMKDPFSEHPDRREKILLSCEEILSFQKNRDDVKIKIRFYSGLQTFRGIFVDYSDKVHRDCFASAYNWIHHTDESRQVGALVTKAVNSGFTWSGSKSSEPEFIKVVENWFDYFWGQGLLHTIAFDFDDTMIRTYQDHINAWEQAIYELTRTEKSFIDSLEPNLKLLVSSQSSLIEYFEDTFIRHEDALEIAHSILTLDARNTALPEKVNDLRYSYRKAALIAPNEELRLQNVLSRAIPNVSESLAELRTSGYPLYVASLTDEQIIEPSLKSLNVSKFFSGVLGRSDYSIRSLKDLSAKTSLLLKVASLAGIPPYRLLFVGDHKNDLNASKNAGVFFLEARVIDTRTHIENVPQNNHLYFTSYLELSAKVRQVEQIAMQQFHLMLDDAINKVRSKPKSSHARL